MLRVLRLIANAVAILSLAMALLLIVFWALDANTTRSREAELQIALGGNRLRVIYGVYLLHARAFLAVLRNDVPRAVEGEQVYYTSGLAFRTDAGSSVAMYCLYTIWDAHHRRPLPPSTPISYAHAQDNDAMVTSITVLMIPFWMLLPPLLIAPAFAARSLTRWCRRHRRKEQGRCHHCGYDLRASKGRCPECGTPIPVQKAGGQKAQFDPPKD